VKLLDAPKVRVYVNSSREAVGTENVVIDKPTVQILSSDPHVALPPRVYATREVRTVTKYEYVLPEQQERLVEIVREVASKYGFQLEVIDVAQIEPFEALPKEVEALKNFPVLATESQTKLALGFSREDVERLLSQETKRKEDKPEH